jgi:predicted aspartyl protease
VRFITIVAAGLPFPAWLLLTLLAACTTETPTEKQAYLANRLPFIDTTQPCLVDAFPPMPVTVAYGRAFVPAWVNGIETVGVLDTGASDSLITPELAAAARAEPIKGTHRLRGVTGSFTSKSVSVRKIAVGSIAFIGARELLVLPFGGSDGAKIGVQVGMDLLDHFDYDMDFPHQTLQPFRTSNCLAIDPIWPDTTTGLALTSTVENLRINSLHQFSFSREVTIPVSFPGGIIEAFFDTGSSKSLLSHAAARRAGVTNAQLDADPVHSITGINGAKRDVYMHTFPDIAIGEDELHNTTIAVTQHFDRRDDDMILGMDYIATHHLWLSLTTNALYIDSGERRALTPPLDRAHIIGGLTQPGFPAEAKAKSGKVEARCWVEADGKLSGCHITHDDPDPAFGKAMMAWLTTAAGPVLQPAYLNGKPIRQEHDWVINFEPAPPPPKR